MTEKANPSINRPAEAFKTAGAIAYGGSDEGFISPANAPTEISVQDNGIDEAQLNAFDETSSASSFDVTIDGGEAFVFGSWLAIDSSTNVSLAADTAGQTVSVGWNKNGADDVIIGLDAEFSSASGDADQKIPLFSFSTDENGVVSVVDKRSFDQISADSIEQGAGSGLDADTIDGLDASELGSNVSNDGTTVTADSKDLNFTENITASDDGDGTSTIAVDQGSGSGLDADTVDGVEASELGSDVSDDGTTVTSSATDLNFTDNITASDDGDGTSTIAVDQGSGSGLDADTVDGLEASDLGSDVSDDGATVTSSSTDLDFTDNITASDDGDGTSTIAVDDAFVLNDGDTMSGPLNMSSNKVADVADPTSPQDAVTKSFADSAFVDVAGDTMSGDLDMDSNKVVGLSEPTQDSDAATKAFVDARAEGLDIKEAVRVCTCGQGDIDLSSSTDPNPIDTVTLNDGDRILLIEQTDAVENGIYEAVDADDPTTWVRTTDANDDSDVNSGMFVLAVEGSESGNVGFVLITPNPIEVGVTELNFTRFSGAEAIDAGDNLQRTGSRLDVVGGDGSGLDADTLDGTELEDISEGYETAVTKTSDHTAIDRQVILADATSNDVNITLPSPTDGQLITVKKIDSSSNSVNILTPGTETIDGQSNISLTNQFSTRETVSNGTDYFII